VKPAIIVLLVVARGEMQEPPLVDLTHAAERALGTDSRIVLHEQVAPLPDDEAVALADQMRVTVVVELKWSADRTRAHLHVHFVEKPGWLERDLVFAPEEPLTERGRTLGFEIATMVPDVAPRSAAQAEPPPPRSDEPGRAIPSRAREGRARFALEVEGVGAIGGEATGFGVGAAGRWISMGGAFVRWGGEARFGRVAAAGGASMMVAPTIGGGWMSGSQRGPLHIGARLDALAQWMRVSRSSPEEARARWVPAIDLLGELSYDTSPTTLLVAIGSEYAFGDTKVRIGDTDTTTLPRLRFLAELGARVRF
jgi:hypothetical protein